VGNSYLATNPFAAVSSSTPKTSWQEQFGLMYSLQVWKMKKKVYIKNLEKKQPKQSILLQINEDASTQTPNTEGATTMSGASSKNESSRMDGCSTNLSHLHSSNKVTQTFT